jgi:hypothetical protein
MLFSTDGKSWMKIDDHHIPHMASVATTFTQTGYLLAMTNHVVVPPEASGSSQALLIVILAVVAVLPISVTIVLRRMRRRPR